MKKFFMVMQMFALIVLLVGCQKETVKEVEMLPIEPEIFQYIETEQADNLVVDENGLLYTSNFIPSDSKEELQQFCIYDLDGTCLKKTEIVLGNGNIQAMVIEDGVLYCVAPKRGPGGILASIDLTTWEVKKIAEIEKEDFTAIHQLVVLGDYFYLFGKSPIAEGQSYTVLPEIRHVNYDSEAIGRISRVEEHAQIEFFAIDVPLNIFPTKNDTLMIYYYNEEKGFGFLEFSPIQETLEEVGEWQRSSGQMSNLHSCEDGFLFLDNSVLHYGTIDGMKAQITTDTSTLWNAIAYVKGFAFYYDYEEMLVERVHITDTLKKNKEIRFLMLQEQSILPNGCGYRMKHNFLNAEAYTLKVLAGDSDFDMFVLSSRDDISYNIKQNGAFYALNEVQGVQEYLDACFPHMKELATNEEGDIWMIPVELAIPVVVYPKEYCAIQQVEFSSMNFGEWLNFVEQVETTTPEKGSVSTLVLAEELFQQYLTKYNTFDTEVFRTYIKQLKDIYDKTGMLLFDFDFISGLRKGEIIEGFYAYEYYLSSLLEYAELIGDLDEIGVVGVPSISEEMGNMGTLTFLAVNPNSKNLEATLEYISTFCHYMMTKQDSFLLQDESTYTDTPFIKECYQAYAKGEVSFMMDSDIYWNQFWDYLDGEITLEEMVEEIERKREIYLGE